MFTLLACTLGGLLYVQAQSGHGTAMSGGYEVGSKDYEYLEVEVMLVALMESLR